MLPLNRSFYSYNKQEVGEEQIKKADKNERKELFANKEKKEEKQNSTINRIL